MPSEQEDITVLRASFSRVNSNMVSPNKNETDEAIGFDPNESEDDPNEDRLHLNADIAGMKILRSHGDKKERSTTPDIVGEILEDIKKDSDKRRPPPARQIPSFDQLSSERQKDHPVGSRIEEDSEEGDGSGEYDKESKAEEVEVFGFEGSDLLFDSFSNSGMQ